jgi:hypothetical protein
MMKKGILLLLCVFVVSCASLQQKRYSNSTEQVIDLINRAQSGELSDITQTPFLLDSEIIILDRDMKDFWERITEAEFLIPNAFLMESSPVTKSTYKEFAPTMEAESFFGKYVTDKAYLVVVETETMRIKFLMDRVKFGTMRIIGMKGPESL